MSNPKNNYNACDDFFVLVVESHIISLTMDMFNMTDMDQTPEIDDLNQIETLWMESAESRRRVLQTITTKIVDSLNLVFSNSETLKTTDDRVKLYGEQLLSLGCFYLEYSDAIREGDGIRVLRCWRYMLPMFVSSQHRNYAMEALNLLLQHDFFLSPRQASELIWSRFVNISGQPGHNIPCDLHLEHLNRILKGCINNLGVNKTERSISRVSKALGTIAPFLYNFDQQCNVSEQSGFHSKASTEKDMKVLVHELRGIFTPVNQHRKHRTYPHPRDPLHRLSKEQINTWIVEHVTF